MLFLRCLLLFGVMFMSVCLPGCFSTQEGTGAKKIKMVIFDFDGTLADTLKGAIAVINNFSDEYGYEKIKEEKIGALRDKPMMTVLREDLKLSFYQLPGFRHKLLSGIDMDSFAGKIKIFKGVSDVLEALAKKYTLAIVTSNKSEIVERVLINNGVKTIKNIHSDTSIFGKHVVIKRLLKKMHLSSSEAVYVGDEVRDIEACKKLHMKIVAVSWGFNSRKLLELYKPDYLIDEPRELLTCI